ncbi:MAG TPA: hypothetical protein VEP66_02420 [Myxococcales bacterium]|nr:hypothetical protein [Myxococcales bacterium]
MWAVLAMALLAASGTTPPVVALLPLRPLGAPPDVVHALEVTLRNELANLPEARLAPANEVAQALKREPDCEARISCAAAAAQHAGARQLIVGTTSQFGDAFMIDLKLLDAKTGQELRRATHPVSGSQNALIETVRETAVQLLAPSRFVGSLRVEVPGASGALLFVDGKPLGTLPLARPLEGLLPGQHVVRVQDKDQETSTFVEVRFGKTTDAHIELGAAQVVSLPAAALPTLAEASQHKPAWVRPAAIGMLGAGVASAVIGLAFHAKAAYSTASDLPGLAASNQLQRRDAPRSLDADQNTNLARGFYVAAAVLTAAGGGLLWWDLSADSVSLTTRF